MTEEKADPPQVLTPSEQAATWQKQVEEARRAREMGKQMRAGKPASFRSAVGRRHA